MSASTSATNYIFAHTKRSTDGCHRIEKLTTQQVGLWYSYNQPAFFTFNGKNYIAFSDEWIRVMKV